MIEIKIMNDKIAMTTEYWKTVGLTEIDLEQMESISVNRKKGLIRIHLEEETKEIVLDDVGLKFYEIFNDYIERKKEEAILEYKRSKK